MPGTPPLLFQQANTLDMHAAIHSLAHVIDRQETDTDASQGFHLDTRLADRLGRQPAPDAACLAVMLEVHGHARQRQWMAQRNELVRTLGCLDSRDAGHTQHVTLGRLARENTRQRFG